MIKMRLALLVLSSCISSTAFAEEVICKDVNGGIDHGYLVNVAPKLGAAEVSMQSIAGPQLLANLTCKSSLKPLQGPGGSLSFSVRISCAEPDLRDAGYSLFLTQTSEAAEWTGQLKEITIVGAMPIAQLTCFTREK